MGTFLVYLVLTIPPLVSSQVNSGVTAVSGAVEIRSLSLLGVDVNRGLVGVKVVSTAKAYTETDGSSVGEERFAPTRCHYAGMNKTPFDGVMLALLHAGADDEASWVIYEPAYDESRCTAPAVSKARLAQAKAAFAKANITMDQKVEFAATPDAKGQLSLKIGDRTVVVQTSKKTDDCDAEADPAKVKASRCAEGFDRILTVTFAVDGQPFYQSWDSYTAAYAGSAELEVLGAFVSGTKVLFLQRLTTASGMQGPSSAQTTISVSPVFDFAK
ncbi:hypothetical protein [Vitiosangium sp. GDMCC 1.1324]|uniref:hypothetical protein n=1 Tax=Vitiosangium sp. (strain GDMCC 1.1324) TaxID=2138576 RepID=UPI000D3925D3|nr:hypothetical protein [Vitiosangium sp. GDMCC 1.1324]PTL85027.1 hypothetical protein DAT35_08280 [Vitiosangium sp. GDMCC 1.1324]